MAAPSTSVRVYLPATLDDLATLWAHGSLHPRAGAYAVSAALRSDDPEADLEEWEFQAFAQASEACLGLLGADGPARRVVVSADIEAARVHEEPAAAPAGVVVDGEVGVAAVAAVHVDGIDAAGRVKSVLDGAPADTLDDVALEWFAPSEVAALLR